MVTDLEGEASNSSQFQSSISESGYSGTFTLGASPLESPLVAESSCTLASGSADSFGGWSAVGVGLSEVVVTIVTAVIGGSGASPV